MFQNILTTALSFLSGIGLLMLNNYIQSRKKHDERMEGIWNEMSTHMAVQNKVNEVQKEINSDQKNINADHGNRIVQLEKTK